MGDSEISSFVLPSVSLLKGTLSCQAQMFLILCFSKKLCFLLGSVCMVQEMGQGLAELDLSWWLGGSE